MSQVTMTPDQVLALAKPRPRRGEKSAKLAAKFAATPPLVQTDAERLAQRSLFERHDRVLITIRLPLAPSANALKCIREIPGRRPILVPTTEYNAYKAAVAKAWKNHFNGWPPDPLTCRLRVRVVVHQARNGGDVANREKALCDALTEAEVWVDDELIDDIHLVRGAVVKDTGAMDVTIESMS